MINKTISHYKITSKLGEGGMGVVYLAQDLKLDRQVALKFLPERLTADKVEKERFVHEAKAASSLNHPNVLTIYEIDEHDGQLFIAMEYCPGQSVKELIGGEKLTLQKTLDIAVQICEGLAAAHENDVVHRDIKSDNIMVTSKGRVKIMDFGLAKLKGATKLTSTGSTLGTVSYMSPEQAQAMEVDHRSDIFSFGVVLYEMITGHLPFGGDHEAAVIYSIVNQTPEPLARFKANVPEGLQRIVDKALAKDRQERYQHIDGVLADLRRERRALESGMAGRAPSGTKAVTSDKKASRSRQFIPFALILLAAVAGYLIVSGLLTKEPPAKDRQSIAVLPFKNLSAEQGSEYFSDGITEDIIAQISKIKNLRVISRTSVMPYKDSQKSLREIGLELGVAAILEGSVRRASGRIRIVSQLIDARTDDHIWSETYDRELEDIFEIQSDVAQQIAQALKVELSMDEKQRLGKRPTENLTAYDYYLKGREYYYRYLKQDNENAIQLFKKALELDPDYVLAYAGLGDAYGQRVLRFGFAEDWLDSSIAVGQKAIALDSKSSEAYKALGLAFLSKGWLSQSLEANRKAVELTPNYEHAIANIGWAYSYLGDLDTAFIWFKKATVLNPTSAFNYFSLGSALYSLGDYSQAEFYLNKSMELQPDLIDSYAILSFLYLEQGQFGEAKSICQKCLAIAPGEILTLDIMANIELFNGDMEKAKQYYERLQAMSSTEDHLHTISLNLAYIYWRTHERERAREMLFDYLEYAQEKLKQGDEFSDYAYDIAIIKAILGEKAEAFQWLQRAVDIGWRNYQMALIDPRLENLHGEKHFQDMMAKVKSMVDEMRRRVEEREKEAGSKL